MWNKRVWIVDLLECILGNLRFVINVSMIFSGFCLLTFPHFALLHIFTYIRQMIFNSSFATIDAPNLRLTIFSSSFDFLPIVCLVVMSGG